MNYKRRVNRREFIGALATVGTVSGTALAQTEEKPATPTATGALTRTPLVLMAPRPDGLEAVWAVTELCKGKLEWESDDGSKGLVGMDQFGFVPQSKDLLRVRLEGLKPGNKYRVRMVTISAADGRTETSEWKTFRTLDPSSAKATFTVWNDTHVNNETIRKLHEVTPSSDFLFWNGDTCNDWKSPDLLVPTLLNPGGCDVTEGRPLLLSWGNHDVRGPHAFEMPEIVATPNSRPFYAFCAGPMAAVCLHTGEDKPDDHPSFGGRVAFDALRREQAHWLAEIIRQPGFRDAPYRVVFCHIPLRWLNEKEPDYAAGGFDRFSLRSRDAWHTSLVEWKTQLVISGHTHRNALIEANEQFPYAQVTGGGPQLKAATWMQGEATAEEFKLRVTGLDGMLRHEVNLRPLV